MAKKYQLNKVEFNAEQRSRVERAQAAAERDREEIVARGRELKANLDQWQEIFSELKAERVRKGLTLDQLAQSTGISKPALSRLENAANPNPTMSTLLRVAEALGKGIYIRLGYRVRGSTGRAVILEAPREQSRKRRSKMRD
ncbi:MAG TPA: helix-turn-helix transcriptional regulator [Pirellulales bacterium]|nr:helix-turn-helix transcriptional regulator [Pirellulales bacterium]